MKYLKFVIHDATGVNKVQYSAISKGKILNFTFSSMTGADLDEDQLLLAEDIVDYTHKPDLAERLTRQLTGAISRTAVGALRTVQVR